MGCNCIKEIEKGLVDHYQHTLEIKSVEFENLAITANGLSLFAPVAIHHEITTKKGIIKDKKLTVNISLSYCPFCGIRLGDMTNETK